MKSVMKHQFSEVPKAEIPRSQFNRSHGHKTTFDAGYLVPIYVDEALPGDTFNMNCTMLGRLNTPIVPIMDNLHCDVFFFAVPLRLIWDNFKKFMGEQASPNDSTDYTVPQVFCEEDSRGFAKGGIFDYFGLPTTSEVGGAPNDISVAAFHARAYNLIYNEWFRDQNLCLPANVSTDDGPDHEDVEYDYPTGGLLRRGKRHDYFTSCLPWPQKGPGVELPLGTSAPILASGDITVITNGSQPTINTSSLTNATLKAASAGATSPLEAQGALGSDENMSWGNQTGMKLAEATLESVLTADLSSATAATINSLRQAFQIQRLYERDARGGTRYTEMIQAHFGVTSPDARLQRPEYLGGSKGSFSIQSVPQTSSTDGTSPQGNLAAYGTFTVQNAGFVKSFTEHCVLLGIANVWADLTYQQGVERMFSRSTRFDYYFPALAHLGEQAVLNKEICYVGQATDDDVFGYQERWAEYRYKPSRITGKMRSADANSLDVWHLSQDFTTCPTLSSSFINENPPIDRVVAVDTEPDFNVDMYFDLKCARPMPVYSVPGKIDHF